MQPFIQKQNKTKEKYKKRDWQACLCNITSSCYAVLKEQCRWTLIRSTVRPVKVDLRSGRPLWAGARDIRDATKSPSALYISSVSYTWTRLHLDWQLCVCEDLVRVWSHMHILYKYIHTPVNMSVSESETRVRETGRERETERQAHACV